MNDDRKSSDIKRTVAIGCGVLLAMAVVGAGGMALLWKNPKVKEVMSQAYQSGKPADVDSPNTFEVEGLRFDYPGNWRASSKSGAPHVRHWVEVNTTDASSMQIILMDATGADEEEILDNSLTGMETTRIFKRTGEEEFFSQWGDFDGSGRELKGKLLMLADATVRLFCASLDTSTLMLIEMRMDSESEKLAAGYDLIEGSFEVLE